MVILGKIVSQLYFFLGVGVCNGEYLDTRGGIRPVKTWKYTLFLNAKAGSQTISMLFK